MKEFTFKSVEDFAHEHIQQKINAQELYLTGIAHDCDEETFEREFCIYENALIEGIINGIMMAGGDVIDNNGDNMSDVKDGKWREA